MKHSSLAYDLFAIVRDCTSNLSFAFLVGDAACMALLSSVSSKRKQGIPIRTSRGNDSPCQLQRSMRKTAQSLFPEWLKTCFKQVNGDSIVTRGQGISTNIVRLLSVLNGLRDRYVALNLQRKFGGLIAVQVCTTSLRLLPRRPTKVCSRARILYVKLRDVRNRGHG